MLDKILFYCAYFNIWVKSSESKLFKRANQESNLYDINNHNFIQAALGIADLLVDAMVEEGLKLEKARDRIFLYDIDGLLTHRREGGVPKYIKHFGKDMEPSKDFAKLVQEIKPTCLIGKYIRFFINRNISYKMCSR